MLSLFLTKLVSSSWLPYVLLSTTYHVICIKDLYVCPHNFTIESP